MIVHDTITLLTPDAPVVFADLAGLSCSVCAPDAMTASEVEAFANAHGPKSNFGKWVTVDKSKLGFLREVGLGQATPNPCNQVAGRKHWFLLNEINAAKLAGEFRR
jgi:hypothetical protein